MTIQQKSDAPFERQIELSRPNSALANKEERLLKQAVLRLNGHILGFIFGVVAALGIFAATNWLVIKGGDEVGPHLSLLSQFFLGYTVTFLGSFIGAGYAFVLSYASGLLIGWIYNSVIFLKNR